MKTLSIRVWKGSQPDSPLVVNESINVPMETPNYQWEKVFKAKLLWIPIVWKFGVYIA